MLSLRADHTMPERRKYTHGSAMPLCEASHNGICFNVVYYVMCGIKWAAEQDFS